MKTPAGYPPTRHSTQSPHRTAGTQKHKTTSKLKSWKQQQQDSSTTTNQEQTKNRSGTGSQSRKPEKSPEHPNRAPGQIVQFRMLNATAVRQSGRLWWDVRRVGKWIPRSPNCLDVAVLCQESTSKVGQDVRGEFFEKQFPTGENPRQ